MTRSYSRPVLLSLLLTIIVLATFHRVVGNQFVDFDDREEIFGNNHLNPVTVQSLNWNWTHTQLSLFMPVTYYAWGAVAALAPRDSGGVLLPWPFHLMNLILHLVCSILVFILLRQLWHRDLAGFVGALVFAVHPLQTEAVAWASGMYTLLSTAMSLGTLILYIAARNGQRKNRDGDGFPSPLFWVATVLYVLGMLTKPASVSLPLVAGVIDYFVLQRVRTPVLRYSQEPGSAPLDPALRSTSETGLVTRAARLRAIRPLLVWVILAVPIVLLVRSFQSEANVPNPPPWGRPIVALDAIGFYLRKLALPRGLIPDYGRNPTWVMSHPGQVGISVSIAIVALLLAWLFRNRARWVTAGLGVFIVGIAPYLGLATFDFQYVSTVTDRYAYFGMVGIAMLACGAAIRERGAMVALLIASVAWSVASYQQVSWWQDTDTLFFHTLAVNPNSLLAHSVLGYEAAHSGRRADAERWYLGALAIWPQDAAIWFDLGNLHVEKDPARAAREYQQAIRYLPLNPAFHKNLAAAMARLHDFSSAAAEYRNAIGLEPNDPDTHYGLGCVLEELNDLPGARREYVTVLQFSPTHAGARASLKRLASN